MSEDDKIIGNVVRVKAAKPPCAFCQQPVVKKHAVTIVDGAMYAHLYCQMKASGLNRFTTGGHK